MADPLSVTASVLAVATAAAVSVRTLCDTIKSFQNRNKTLRRLLDKLQDFTTILDSLVEVVNADTSILALLRGPVDRCSVICNEFEQSLKKFHGKSRTGFLDWTKLEFMRGDINDFIDSIENYKSTITVGLCTITLRNSQVSREVLQQYDEMIKDTTYNLEDQLRRIDEELTQHHDPDDRVPDANIDLQDERAVTQQCLRVCQDASFYIESLATRESTLLRNGSSSTTGHDMSGDFEAQRRVRQALAKTQITFFGLINSLGEHLQTMVTNGGAENDRERLQLQADLDMSKQCLQLCKMAGETYHQKIHTIGEAIAEEHSDQVIVTTFADLFDVKRARSKGYSAQLVATLTPDNFDRVIEKRYNSRFGALPDRAMASPEGSAVSTDVPNAEGDSRVMPPVVSKTTPPSGTETRRNRPNPNEVRKRHGDGGNERRPTSPKQ